MKRLLLAASCFLLSIEAAKAEVDCQTRPSWCVSGYSCTPTTCAIELRIQLEEALRDKRDLERKAGRLHFDLTCGLGVATVVTQEWDLKAYPTPGACVYGVALRIGK